MQKAYPSALCLRTGSLVRVRRARWRVEGVQPYGECARVSLVGASPTNVSVARSVLTPFDDVEPAAESEGVRVVGLRRWRTVCRSILSGADAGGALKAAARARIDLLPHQLEPALAVVRGGGCRVLLADAVGLGKTIEAGLIVAELLARDAADRVLVLTPAGLRDQWREELKARFGLECAVLDAAEVRRRNAGLAPSVNPWATAPICVASLDYVKRPEVLAAVTLCRWDVVVVDEAHNVSPGSDRLNAVNELAGRAGYVVLATATPHGGDATAFASLCGIGARNDAVLVFRRTRSDVRLGAGRHVHHVHIRPTAAERRLHDRLAALTRVVRAEHRDEERSRLALAVLHKRAFSSARSLEVSVRRRLEALGPVGITTGDQLPLPLLSIDGDDDPRDEAPEWAGLELRDERREHALLAGLADAAREAGRRESKLAALARLLRRAAEPAIVFTEFRDTLAHVREALGLPAAVLHGGLTRADRVVALGEFASGRVRLLLATDAAAEGLNLHQGCRIVVNVELPWSPVRLEQRIGRVDRIGQRRTVHVFHLIASASGEERVLARLRERIARARQDLGCADPLTDERAMAHLVVGGHGQPGEAGGPAAQCTPPGVRLVCLTDDGRAEADRLAAARRLAPPDRALVVPVPLAPIAAFARRPRTRAWLGRTLLIIAALDCRDGFDRLTARKLVALRVARGDDRRLSRGVLQRLLDEVQPGISAIVEQSLGTWAAGAIEVDKAFEGVRIVRERALGEATQGPDREYQAGLFDSRARRAHESDGRAAAIREEDQARRLQRLELAAARSVAPPRILLVLVG